MAAETPPGISETVLSDRAILLHILQHAESIDERLASLETELERWRPLLAMFGPAAGGRPDAISAAQGWRALRSRNRSGGNGGQ